MTRSTLVIFVGLSVIGGFLYRSAIADERVDLLLALASDVRAGLKTEGQVAA